MSKPLFLLALLAAVAACRDDWTLAPPPNVLRVVSYNVYLGADESPILAAPADQVPLVAAEVWAAIQATDFPARAGRIAERIASALPDVVGLQEAVLYRVQSPGDAARGGTTPATAVRYDFLQLVLDSLGARGLTYTATAADTTSDVEVPVVTGVDGAGRPTFDDVRLTDRDAILVRDGVTFTNPQHGVFTTNLPVAVGGVPATIARGWGSVDATVQGATFRFVNTHLLDYDPDIQVAQAQELLAGPAATNLPVILVGDLNTRPDGSTTATYRILAEAGFADSWLLSWPNLPGSTNGQAADLANVASRLSQRIDFVLLRETGDAAHRLFGHVAHAEILGDRPEDRTAGGLWPSDHAGLAVHYQIGPP